jgi:hypothetical protein
VKAAVAGASLLAALTGTPDAAAAPPSKPAPPALRTLAQTLVTSGGGRPGSGDLKRAVTALPVPGTIVAAVAGRSDRATEGEASEPRSLGAIAGDIGDSIAATLGEELGGPADPDARSPSFDAATAIAATAAAYGGSSTLTAVGAGPAVTLPVAKGLDAGAQPSWARGFADPKLELGLFSEGRADGWRGHLAAGVTATPNAVRAVSLATAVSRDAFALRATAHVEAGGGLTSTLTATYAPEDGGTQIHVEADPERGSVIAEASITAW